LSLSTTPQLVFMTPIWRKWTYAVTYEVIGMIMATAVLAVAFRESAALGLVLSAIMSLQALQWKFLYNHLFEAWERRQPVRGRSVLRRCLHAVLFDCGLTILTVPVIIVMVDTGLLQALLFDEPSRFAT